MARELEMGGLGLGMGFLELGFHHHGMMMMEPFSTSSSSSAAYGSCGWGGGGGDANLYGLLPTSNSSTTAALVASAFPPVDEMLDFSAKDGFLQAAAAAGGTAGTANASSNSYLGNGHGGHLGLPPQHQQQQQHQQPFLAAYGSAASAAATGNYSMFPDNNNHHHHRHSSSSAGSDLAAFPDDLYIPCEDAAELEWLSKFVDDSSDIPFHIPGVSTAGIGFPTTTATTTTANSNSNQYNNSSSSSSGNGSAATAALITRVDPSVGVIPGRARSKRTRLASPAAATATTVQMGGASASAAGLPWSSSHLAQQQLASPSSSSSSSSETKLTRTPVSGGKKKRDSVPVSACTLAGGLSTDRAGGGSGGSGMGAAVRRCTHCSSEKTPQWRTGPLGPKTLCNACGVRYKSGRLVPEYRPAASPTFVLTQHSNSHRKVMELRRQKEILLRHQPQHHDVVSAARGMAAVAAASIPVGVLAPTRPDLLLRDFEVR